MIRKKKLEEWGCKMIETNDNYRLLNPDIHYAKERLFLEVFEDMCKSGFNINWFGGVATNGVDAVRCLSEDEKRVAYTVIQWLGTLGGQDFIKSVDEKMNQK